MVAELDDLIESVSIERVAEHLGLRDKYKDESVLWRADKTPSMSIIEGRLAYDWTRGVTVDSLGCYALCRGLDRKDAIPDFCSVFGERSLPWIPSGQKSDETRLEKRSRWPEFSQGRPEDWQRVADLRKLDVRAIELAARTGLLCFCRWGGENAWLVTDRCFDDDRRPLNAQARRMDGRPWEQISAKAWTLPGSRAGHVVGLSHVGAYETFILTEGGPDLLAALHVIEATDRASRWGALAIMGAGMNISEREARSLFGRTVLIVPDRGDAGAQAGERWANQLYDAGATIRFFDLPQGIDDLNEFVIEEGGNE